MTASTGHRWRAMRGCLCALAVLASAACTTTDSRIAATSSTEKPPAGSVVVLVAPELSLSEIGATGLGERRPAWEAQAGREVTEAIEAHVTSRGFAISRTEREALMQGRRGQVVRLHDAVVASMVLHTYSPGFSLPSRGAGFNWTVGEGAREFSPDGRGGYALFVGGSGCWSSSGRVALGVAALVLTGTVMQTCQQVLYASLIRLETGQIVWFNRASAGPGDDMRTDAGANRLIAAVLKDAPF